MWYTHNGSPWTWTNDTWSEPYVLVLNKYPGIVTRKAYESSARSSILYPDRRNCPRPSRQRLYPCQFANRPFRGYLRYHIQTQCDWEVTDMELPLVQSGHKYTATRFLFTHNSITSTIWALLFEYVMRKA